MCVTYTGDLTLAHVEEWRRPPIGPTGVVQRPPFELGPPVGPLSSVSTIGPAASRGGRTPSSPTFLDPRMIANIPSPGSEQLYWAPIHDIGTFTLILCCDFDYEDNPGQTQVSIYALLSAANVNIQVPQGDVSIFYDKFIKPTESSLTSPAGLSRFPIAPTISLVGRDPASVSVPEIPNFDVSVFYVNSYLPSRQALVAAFNLMPGCKGTIEDVQDFVNYADYGVISDEFLIERIFMHKWAQGAFYRTFPAQNTVQVKRNDHQEDATIFGTLHLDSLDWVSIECEANTGTDYVRIGGSATATATSIQLQDGTILGPNDVDMGPPNQNPWSVYTNFDINPSLSSDPEMRAFQIQAHYEAYQYCARPFANSDATEVMYARTEGVLKRVFFLGTFPESD